MIRAQQQSGFSIIEVLAAVLILAVGILGVAGLQVVSMQQNRSALLRAQALQIGTDMLDRMRANPTGDYDAVDFDDPPDNAAPTCINANCTEVQMAEFDIAQWKCSINSIDPDTGDPYTVCETYGMAGALPNGAGQIAVLGDIHTVSVRWQWGPNVGDVTTVDMRTRTQ